MQNIKLQRFHYLQCLIYKIYIIIFILIFVNLTYLGTLNMNDLFMFDNKPVSKYCISVYAEIISVLRKSLCTRECDHHICQLLKLSLFSLRKI